MPQQEIVAPAADLFLDRQDRLQYRDLMNLMEYPFFSISKQPVYENRIYARGDIKIEVRPGHRGLATIWDKDVLIYVASQINRMINEGQPVSPKVRFHAHDFFVSCGRSAGGRAYEDLAAALDRLQSTSIRTNISTKNGATERTFFSWIKSGRMTERRLPSGKMALGMVEVEIEDWVWRQITEDRTILAIDQAYFSLTSGVARRVYELARKHCGRSPSWSINLPLLAEKIGYTAEDQRHFKTLLAKLVEENDLPEYQIRIVLQGDKEEKSVTDLRSVRGIKSLKAVFSRRHIVSDRREQAEANVSDRRAPALPAPAPVAEPEDRSGFASPEDFQKLIASLGSKMRVAD